MTRAPRAVDLRTEHRVEPLGLDEPRPTLSWRVELAPAAVHQASFTVQVGRARSFAPATIVWTLDGDGRAAAIDYDGPPPGSRERRYWRVRLRDDRGATGPWSATASWEMGLLAADDWAAEWIAWIDPALSSWSSRSPLLRRSFRLPEPAVRRGAAASGRGAAAAGRGAGARRPVAVRARAYVTALGLVELTINGRRVGEERLAPGWTDYRHRIRYRAYDVLGLLRPGENVVAARLGRGWYAGDVGQFGAEQYGDYPALLARIEVVLGGGRRLVVRTDHAWRAHPGPLVADDLLMGERVDARDEPVGWTEPGFRDEDWRPVIATAGPGGRLVAARDEGIAVVAELAPASVTMIGADRQVVDVGQNIAGHLRIRASADAGTEITIRHAEALDPAGELYTASLRTARQTDGYTFRGTGDEIVEPRFTVHGFRYAEISGLSAALEPDRLTARAISSMGRPTGSFACSDELVNAIHRNVLWGLRGGLVGLPVDCPQRDERLGWTADAAGMAPSALFLGDTARVFEEWLVDLADAQLPSGAYPDIAPVIGVTGSGNAGWADAGISVPWLIHERTGDRRVVERQYDSMRRYLGFLEASHVDGLRHGGRYGDWLALEPPASLELIGTAFVVRSADLFARMARLLGRDADAAAADRLAAVARRAFRRRFATADGTLAVESQTGYALALGYELLPSAVRPAAADRLAALVEAADAHLRTGFLGTPVVLDALSDHGHHELATRVVRQETFPGWGFEVRQGATTVWERWDSWTPEGGFADPGMNSLNHAALGSVADWLHRAVAGLAPGEPGYATTLVRPRPGIGFGWARASHESRHGHHEVAWSTDDGRLELTVETPPNTTARVILPGAATAVEIDGRPVSSGPASRDRRTAERVRTLDLPWGRHVIHAALDGSRS